MVFDTFRQAWHRHRAARAAREQQHRDAKKPAVTPVTELWLRQKYYSNGLNGEEQFDGKDDPRC